MWITWGTYVSDDLTSGNGHVEELSLSLRFKNNEIHEGFLFRDTYFRHWGSTRGLHISTLSQLGFDFKDTMEPNNMSCHVRGKGVAGRLRVPLDFEIWHFPMKILSKRRFLYFQVGTNVSSPLFAPGKHPFDAHVNGAYRGVQANGRMLHSLAMHTHYTLLQPRAYCNSMSLAHLNYLWFETQWVFISRFAQVCPNTDI